MGFSFSDIPGASAVKGIFYGPDKADTSGIKQAGQVADEDHSEFERQYRLARLTHSTAPTMQGPQESYQRAAANYALASLRGDNPSVAEMQRREGEHAALAAQASLAQSARGPQAALAQRQAAGNAASLMAAGNQQAALLRAQEAAQAQRTILDASGQMQQAGTANLEAQLKTRGYDDEQAANLARFMLQANQQSINAKTGAAGVDAKNAETQNQYSGNVLSLGGKALL